MEWYLISGYAAVCIAFFAILRIPLNRWTVPTASISGIVLTFALVQLLNYYHPYSNMSRQYLATAPNTSGEIVQATGLPAEGGEHTLIAWFNQNSLFRLKDGSTAEVTFDSLPGKVFTGETRMVLPMLDEDQVWAQNKYLAPSAGANQSRVPVLISITDPRYKVYVARVPGGSHARTAIYGEQLHQLALVRKTLLRMTAWMNYLSLYS